jgi:hypothetical protein
MMPSAIYASFMSIISQIKGYKKVDALTGAFDWKYLILV